MGDRRDGRGARRCGGAGGLGALVAQPGGPRAGRLRSGRLGACGGGLAPELKGGSGRSADPEVLRIYARAQVRLGRDQAAAAIYEGRLASAEARARGRVPEGAGDGPHGPAGGRVGDLGARREGRRGSRRDARSLHAALLPAPADGPGPRRGPAAVEATRLGGPGPVPAGGDRRVHRRPAGRRGGPRAGPPARARGPRRPVRRGPLSQAPGAQPAPAGPRGRGRERSSRRSARRRPVVLGGRGPRGRVAAEPGLPPAEPHGRGRPGPGPLRLVWRRASPDARARPLCRVGGLPALPPRREPQVRRHPAYAIVLSRKGTRGLTRARSARPRPRRSQGPAHDRAQGRTRSRPAARSTIGSPGWSWSMPSARPSTT